MSDLSVNEVATRLGINPSRVYALIREGRIKAARTQPVMVSPREVGRFEANRRRPGRPPITNRPERGPKPKEESMAQIEVKPRQTWVLGPPGGDIISYYVMDITTRVRRSNGERRSVLCASCVVGGTGNETLIDLDDLKPPRYRLVRDEHGKRAPVGEED